MSIRRHALFVFICVCGCVLGGSWYVANAPKQYDSIASLKIQSADTFPQTLGATGADMEAQAERVRGYVVLSMAMSSDEVASLPSLQSQSSPMNYVRSRLRVSTATNPDQLQLSLVSTEPSDARTILDAIAAAFVRASASKQPPGGDVVVSVAGPAETLATVVWPEPIPVLAVSILAGLIVGCALSVASDALCTVPLDPKDAAMTVRAPLLGCVPVMAPDLSTPALRGQSVLLRPSSKASAGWDQIRRALDSIFVTNFDKTILITAAGKARGKSLIASNIAIAMAQSGHRVVLVDGHPDHPLVGDIFGVQQSSGLGDAIEGRVDLKSALKVTGLPGLEVLPAGMAVASWRQLLNSQQFMDLLGDLAERFDRVIIDAGPAASDECRILAAYCDIAVLLADGRTGSRRDLRCAAADLRMIGARVAGIVWNRSPRDAIAPLRSIAQIKERESGTSPGAAALRADPSNRTTGERMESALQPHL